jgi:uncharacterized protein
MDEVTKQSFTTAPLDYMAEFIELTFINGKFYSIFSILFGIGFVVQFNNIMNRGKNFPGFFARRMTGLLLIGLVHLCFLWIGDILTLYALLGFCLIPFRNTSDKRLLIWASILLILPVVQWLIMYSTGFFYPGEVWRFYISEFAEPMGLAIENPNNPERPRLDLAQIVAADTIPEFFRVRIGMPLMRLTGILYEGRIFKVLALFLIGIWAGRQILNKNILENRAFLMKIFIWGLLIGIPMNLARTYAQFADVSGPLWEALSFVFYAGGVVPTACSYAALVALIVLKHHTLLGFFAPVGRMALSNYLFQTVLSLIIYHGIGFHLSGQLGYSMVMLTAIGIFTWQILFSTIWLRYYKFGPAEWIWRQMTYGKFMSIRRRKSIALIPEVIADTPSKSEL